MRDIIQKFKWVHIALILLLICSCSSNANVRVVIPHPRTLQPQDVPAIMNTIPSYTTFSYTGLKFFNEKLYASSNIGLLEYNGSTLSNLYKWFDKHDVIEGLSIDIANNSIWAVHYGIAKLIRYDGKVWELLDIPRPKAPYTRGDILGGFRGTGTSGGFWLEGGRNAWRWIGKESVWEPVPIPQNGDLVRIIPLASRILLVMRHEPWWFQPKDNRFKSDSIHYYEDGQFKILPKKTDMNFLTEEIAIIKDVAYIRTTLGFILRVTPDAIEKMEAPGDCEAMVVTTAGSLLVSFRNSGLYEYKNGWQRKFSSPYSTTEKEHWAYLAESYGQVAFAIVPMPQWNGKNQKYLGQTSLWVSRGSILEEIKIKD